MDREKWGTIAAHLQEHINNLKDDRVKTTADLIVQAARGRVYEGRRWDQRFDPVDVIIMEDLNRYLFRTDRPKHENRQLMRWAHRQLRIAVEQQAELYGIAVVDAPAAYSSRFDSKTRSPGVRCRPMTRALLDSLNSGKAQWLEKRLLRLGIDQSKIEIADLMPLGDGELLASFDQERGLRVSHADINAAQNLACRLLEAYSVPIRIVATKVGDTYVNANLGARNEAAFGGKVVALRPGDGGYRIQVYRDLRSASKATEGNLSKAKSMDSGASISADSDDSDLLFETVLQEELESSGVKANFFFDPSLDLWKPTKVFWPEVEADVLKRLRAEGRLHG